MPPRGNRPGNISAGARNLATGVRNLATRARIPATGEKSPSHQGEKSGHKARNLATTMGNCSLHTPGFVAEPTDKYQWTMIDERKNDNITKLK